MQNRPRRMRPPSRVLLLAALSLLAATAAEQNKPSVEQEASLSLKSILEHQRAIELECAQYKRKQESQLERLARLEQEHDQLHLPPALPIRVPAVCLFLSASLASDQQPAGSLELINWLLTEDELAGRRARQDNMTKRHTLEPDSMLNDYLLDPLAGADYASNEVVPEDVQLIQQQVEQLRQDKRFGPTIDANRAKLAGQLSPVILVPGLLGSRLQARTDKSRKVNIFCSKQSDWQDMWLSLRMLLPLAVDCWLDNVRLELDDTSGFTREPSGVETRVADFGSVESVRHLDRRQPKVTAYFSHLIERYEQLGYVADQNLLAAPYDFRLAPQQLTGYFLQLKQLVEQAQAASPSRQPVTLVCHSMGCTHLLIFLRLQSAAWRQARIRKMIALSSPWGGAFKALKALLVGDQLDLPLVSESKMRKLARTYPSIAYLLPQEEIFARTSGYRSEYGGPILVQTPARGYKVNQLDELLRDLNLTTQLNWFQQTAPLIKPLEPLADLRVDCIHSLNTPTSETLIFSKQTSFPDGEYQLVKGEGDGTVNFESLMVCADWAKQLPDKVKHKVIMSTNHMGVLSHKNTLTHITNDVFLDG